MIGRLCGSEKGESTHGKVRAEGRFLSGTSEAVVAAYMFDGRNSGGHSGRVPSVMCAVWRSFGPSRSAATHRRHPPAVTRYASARSQVGGGTQSTQSTDAPARRSVWPCLRASRS